MATEITPLAYNGQTITAKAEMLSLTDMWKASGSDPQQAPAKWRALPATKAFVSAVEVTVGFSDSDLFRVHNGGRQPGTWGHWQIALAYAKYLSPDFHMWCNTVVRDRMEGRPASLPAEILADFERTLGIMKATIHKVTLIERTMERLEAAKAAPTFDLAASVTSDQMIEMAGILKKSRVRGTSNMVTAAMLDFCNGVGCFRTPEHLNPSRPWRFPRETASEWLFGEQLGAERVRNQIARICAKRLRRTGQSAFQLVAPTDPEARP